VIRASLKELVTDGRLGPIRLGIARRQIAELLGEPDQHSLNSHARHRKRFPPAIWKYGDIELHFAHPTDQLYLIFLERFTVPSGGAKLQLDPWIIQQSLTVDRLEQALERNHIPIDRARKAYDDPDTLRLRAGVGVEFLFTTTGRADRSPAGLTAASYSDTASTSQP
jgi:hypothetical protein